MSENNNLIRITGRCSREISATCIIVNLQLLEVLEDQRRDIEAVSLTQLLDKLETQLIEIGISPENLVEIPPDRRQYKAREFQRIRNYSLKLDSMLQVRDLYDTFFDGLFIRDLEYEHEVSNAVENEMLKLALDDALAKATKQASYSGYKLGRIVSMFDGEINYRSSHLAKGEALYTIRVVYEML